MKKYLMKQAGLCVVLLLRAGETSQVTGTSINLMGGSSTCLMADDKTDMLDGHIHFSVN